MSSTQTAPSSKTADDVDRIQIYSHSNLFYWWPVWFFGFLFGFLSLLDHHREVVVPYPNKEGNDKTQVVRAGTKLEFENNKIDLADRDVILIGKVDNPKDRLPTDPDPLRLHTASHSSYGVWFLAILLMVLVITNTSLRGIWSLLVIIIIGALLIILGLAKHGERTYLSYLFEWVGGLDVRINAAGYFIVAIVLLVVWAFTFFYFDHQTYIIFTQGQLLVCTEIGGGEKAYDTAGMTLEKHRSNLFLHKILGGFLLFRIGPVRWRSGGQRRCRRHGPSLRSAQRLGGRQTAQAYRRHAARKGGRGGQAVTLAACGLALAPWRKAQAASGLRFFLLLNRLLDPLYEVRGLLVRGQSGGVFFGLRSLAEVIARDRLIGVVEHLPDELHARHLALAASAAWSCGVPSP